MLLHKLLLFLSAFGLAMANTITFVSLDEGDRTVWSRHKLKCKDIEKGYCINKNLIDIKPFNVTGFAHLAIDLPLGWEGNFYSTPAGSQDYTGMLAEIAWQGYENGTYFDVSAIENPDDHVGVKQFWPVDDPDAEVSGCIKFPCPYAYYHSDDVQTKRATWSTNFFCTLGNANLKKNPHLARWHMVYNDEWQKWHPLSITLPPFHGGAEERLIYVPGGGESEPIVSEGTTANKYPSMADIHIAVLDKTDIANKTASSYHTFVTSVKKHAATPTSTASHGHGHTAAQHHTASN